ncbi:MAG: tRNA (N(6)-L-threonylcarbamoyladenosine(37)-C(2))-methylthiotransferase MtaB [Thermodesulfobacteriota bacterium]|nr:tRNA (N(6)-L-threonylcarbamoyladenosine(37)-C(2))-methylthiotransferase MtaB [Thermodesulfobacteriota bacterium]
MKKSFKIITLGCKVNQYESAWLEERFILAGYYKAVKGEPADVAVINTCIVTQKAAHQSRQAISKALRENPGGMVAAVGCYAQVFPDDLSRMKGIGLIAGNTVKGRLHEFLLNEADPRNPAVLLKDFQAGMPFELLPIKSFSNRTRAYLKIQDGCESFCSYCIVPFARGPYRSLDPEKALCMLETLSEQGYKEVVLTGIHLGRYGIDLKEDMNLSRLLQAIGKRRIPVRIRLSSIEPNEINDEIIEMMANENRLCRHFHISLQSGDDRILQKMNRRYTSQDFARLVERIYAKVPQAAIGVDIMSGFPGEEQVSHQNTFALIRDLPVSYLHVFPFSSRSGTSASDFDGQVDPAVITVRAADLRDMGKLKKAEFFQRCLGHEFEAICEGWHTDEKISVKAVSDNYLPLTFPATRELRGELVVVHAEKVAGNRVTGSCKQKSRTIGLEQPEEVNS